MNVNRTQHPEFIGVAASTVVLLKQLELMEETQRQILSELRKLNSVETLDIKDIGADLADDGKLNRSNRRNWTKKQ